MDSGLFNFCIQLCFTACSVILMPVNSYWLYYVVSNPTLHMPPLPWHSHYPVNSKRQLVVENLGLKIKGLCVRLNAELGAGVVRVGLCRSCPQSDSRKKPIGVKIT